MTFSIQGLRNELVMSSFIRSKIGVQISHKMPNQANPAITNGRKLSQITHGWKISLSARPKDLKIVFTDLIF
jgi:hypothetical protein